ncbi:MAG TPA: hypothetical protein VFH87_15380, partial [Candidatus Udaeobacter sp.]|nr:hypothetical protein [Candidatus Udaeobacter sp.]
GCPDHRRRRDRRKSTAPTMPLISEEFHEDDDEQVLAVAWEYPLTLQLRFWKMSESMGNHDSEVVDASSVD